MTFLSMVLFALLIFWSEAQAQILWEHKTADAWFNQQTQTIDSSICFTALSCNGDNCTAAAILFDSLHPAGRIAFYRSNNGGISWFLQPHNIAIRQDIANWGLTNIQQIDSLNVVAIGDHGVIMRTTDAGTTWFRTDCPVERELSDIHFSDPNTGILTCRGIDSAVFTTIDGGINWIYHKFSWFPSCHSYGNGKFRLYAYGHGPILTTYDNFQTIDTTAPIFDSISDPGYHYILGRCFFGNGDTIFAAGNYRQSDSANTSHHYFAMIMRTVDGGKTWEEPWISDNIHWSFIRKISSLDRDTIFASGGYYHYIISTDRGSTWRMDTVVLDTIYDASELCLGMGISKDGHPVAIFGNTGFRIKSLITRGVFVPASVEGIERIKYLTHFYPNPTTGMLTIESILKSKTPVAIVDIFGRTLAKSWLSEEGKLTLDLSHLQPGLYNVVFDYGGRVFIAGKVLLIH